MNAGQNPELPSLSDTLKLNSDALVIWRERMRAWVRRFKRIQPPVGLDTSDVVQDGMTQVCTNIESFRGSTSQEFEAWIKKISAGNIANAYRRAYAQKRDVRRSVPFEGSIPVANCPSTQAEKNETLCRIASAIDLLAPDLQNVVIQHVIQDHSISTIAREMGCSRRAAKQLCDTALQQILEYVEKNSH